MSDILPPCELPDIGFGTLPVTVAAASVAAAGIVVVLASRHHRAALFAALCVAVAAVGAVSPPGASASGPRNCEVVVPNSAEVPEEDLLVIAPGSTISDDVDTVIPAPEPSDADGSDGSDVTSP